MKFLGAHISYFLNITMSVLALACAVISVVALVHSDLFLVRVVEVGDLPENSPMSIQEITELANVPVDLVSLFSLKIKPIEKSLVAHPWIHSVAVTKRFPQTVSLSIEFEKPVAIVQERMGSLRFLNQEGFSFSPIRPDQNFDLPILIGFKNNLQIQEALRWIQTLEQTNTNKKEGVRLSSLEVEEEKGVRAVISFPLDNQRISRLVLDLGDSEWGGQGPTQVARVFEVIRYLKSHNIDARHVFANLGKKIVVKIAHSS